MEREGPGTPKIFILSKKQIDRSIMNRIDLSFLEDALSYRNKFWKEKIHLAKKLEKVKYEMPDETIDITVEKTKKIKKLPVSFEIKDIPEKSLSPRFGEMFYYKLPGEKKIYKEEQTAGKEGNEKLSYKIFGPISNREIQNEIVLISSEEVSAFELKLRFWVEKSGWVNQVIIEEGSGFPIVDAEIIEVLKKWKFGPVYMISAPKYQWGVMNIRAR